jgi:multidrug transporter EmrE-like cation transporter
MGRALHYASYIYLGLGILAVAAIPISMFGPDPDAMSGIFAYLFSLPWVLVLTLFDNNSTWVATAVAAVGIGINFLLLRWLSRRFAR